MFKQIIKKCFSFFGLEISKTKKAKIHAIDAAEVKRNYYCNEGLRFRCLKRYDFKTILDIGANEGQFAGKILTVFPKAHIHCFEPLKDAFEQLKNNFKENYNITFYNYGLGNENKTVEIFKNEYSPSSSLLKMLDVHKNNFDFAIQTEQETIKIKILDEVLIKEIETPFLVKIDVQGYEKFVLEGGENIISKADVIIIEISFALLYDRQPLFDDIYLLLKKMDFKYAGSLEQLNSTSNNEILQQDALFIKNTIRLNK